MARALFHNLFIKVLNREEIRTLYRRHILDLINQRDQALHNFEKVKLLMISNISPNCETKSKTLIEKLKDIFIITKL